MNLDLETLSDTDILGILRKARVVPSKGALLLQRFPTNYGRKESQRRESFRVWAGKKAIIHLSVGPSLGSLHRKSEVFCRQNPSISCRPLFLVRHRNLDFLGSELFGLFNLEEALSARRIDANGWQLAVDNITSAIDATSKPSSLVHLIKELEELEQGVLSIDGFTRLDRLFLRESVFPLVQQGASGQASLHTTWTNGDFIAKNILVDERGQSRLIDYEFARRTHFRAGDWFRLGRFSNVPEGAKREDLAATENLPPWLEIQCWLDHAIKMSRVSSPAAMQRDLPKISEKLARLVETATQMRPDSVFFTLASSATDLATPTGRSISDEGLVVEWSRHGSPPYTRTTRVSLQPHEWNEVHVDLSAGGGRTLLIRLRLPTIPCVVELRSAEVHGRERANILWTIASNQLGSVLSTTGNLLESATADGLGLIHFGGESLVSLPSVRLTKADSVVGLVLWVRFIPSLLDFSHRLRQAFAEGDVPALLSEGRALTRIDGEFTPRFVTAQLFIPAGDNVYHEDRSVRAPLREVNTWTELAFDLPPLPAGAVLRYDPTDQPGLLEIAGITVEALPDQTASAMQIVTRQKSQSHLERLECEGDALLVSDDNSVRILLFGPDPILKLAPFGPDLAGHPQRLTINFRYTAGAPTTLWAKALQSQRDAALMMNVRLHEAEVQCEATAANIQQLVDEAVQSRQQGDEKLATATAGSEKLGVEITQLQADAISARDASALREREFAVAIAVGKEDLQAARSRESELHRTLVEQAQQQTRLSAELEAMLKEIAGLQNLLRKEMESSEQAGRALAAAQTESENLRGEMARHRAAALAAQEGVDQRDQELQAARNREAALTQTRDGLFSELEGARLETAEVKEQLARQTELNRANEKLSVDLEASRLETVGLQDRLVLENQNRLQVEQMLAATRETAVRYEHELQAARNRETELRQSSGELSVELEAARREAAEILEHFARERQNRLQAELSLTTFQETADRRAAEAAITMADLGARLKDTGNQLQALELKYDLLLESLYAQNVQIQNVEHVAGIVCQERDTLTRDYALARMRNKRLETVRARADRLSHPADEPPLLAAAFVPLHPARIDAKR